jgi:hypothetical protein
VLPRGVTMPMPVMTTIRFMPRSIRFFPHFVKIYGGKQDEITLTLLIIVL